MSFFSGPSRLSIDVSVASPIEFRSSIEKLKRNGLNVKQYNALIIAQKRARQQLKRKDLTMKEREKYLRICLIRIPKPKK